MSDFSDIDGGEEPLFAEYEDEELVDPPPLPPPLAILNNDGRDGRSLGINGDDEGFNFDQQFNTSRNDSRDQSSSAAPTAKKRKPMLTFNEGRSVIHVRTQCYCKLITSHITQVDIS